MPSLNPRAGMFFAATLVVASFYCVCNATIAVKGGGDERTLASLTTEGAVLASIRGLCDIIGVTSRWNKTAQKLTCVKGNRKIVFSEDVPFYYSNGSLLQLPCAPVRMKTVFYLPAWLTVSVLSSLVDERIEWDEDDVTIIIGEAAAVEADASERPNEEPVEAAAMTSESSSTHVRAEPVGLQQLIKTIVIDPGHGGKDPGAIGPHGAKEKDIVLSVGLKLRDMLKKKNNFRFI